MDRDTLTTQMRDGGRDARTLLTVLIADEDKANGYPASRAAIDMVLAQGDGESDDAHRVRLQGLVQLLSIVAAEYYKLLGKQSGIDPTSLVARFAARQESGWSA